MLWLNICGYSKNRVNDLFLLAVSTHVLRNIVFCRLRSLSVRESWVGWIKHHYLECFKGIIFYTGYIGYILNEIWTKNDVNLSTTACWIFPTEIRKLEKNWTLSLSFWSLDRYRNAFPRKVCLSSALFS